VPTFVSFAASIAELADGEKLYTKTLNHSPSLFDALGSGKTIYSLPAVLFNISFNQLLSIALDYNGYKPIEYCYTLLSLFASLLFSYDP